MSAKPSSAHDAVPARVQPSVWLALAVGQTIIWAGTFYLFPALLPVLEIETGYSRAALTGVLTASLLTTAATSTFVGNLIDRGRGPRTVIGGATGAAIILILISASTAFWQFALLWILLGICMAASLYEPCFAILIRHLGTGARPTITRITLIAGFAGTVSFPIANLIANSLGWRGAVVCFALAIGFVSMPLFAFAWRRLNVSHNADHIPNPPKKAQTYSRSYRLTFWALAIAIMMISIQHGMIVTHLLPLLAERGVAPAIAIAAASSIGPMQVFGRLAMMAYERRLSNSVTMVCCFCGQLLGTGALAIAGATPALIFMFVCLQGASWGVVSIIRPVLTNEYLGAERFGALSGRISGLAMLGTALAPFLGTLMWQIGGYNLMLAFAATIVLLGLILLATSHRHHKNVSKTVSQM